jgi:putative protease
MPEKIKVKKTAKKAAKRKPAGKPVKRKVLTKKSPPGKKTAKKKVAKNKPLKKKAPKKPARRAAVKKTGRPAMPMVSAIEITVEPGPPPRPLPPLEEPAGNEFAVGTVTHYYSHLSVVVVQINKGELKAGDTIHIKGNSTDIVQTVESMEYEHRHVDRASAGQSVGIKIKDHAREHDIVYRVG